MTFKFYVMFKRSSHFLILGLYSPIFSFSSITFQVCVFLFRHLDICFIQDYFVVRSKVDICVLVYL